GEGDRRGFARGYRHPPELPAIRGDERLAVWRERHARHEIASRLRGDLIVLCVAHEPALVTRGELAQAKGCLFVAPCRVDEPPVVRAHDRAHADDPRRRTAHGLSGRDVEREELWGLSAAGVPDR